MVSCLKNATASVSEVWVETILTLALGRSRQGKLGAWPRCQGLLGAYKGSVTDASGLVDRTHPGPLRREPGGPKSEEVGYLRVQPLMLALGLAQGTLGTRLSKNHFGGHNGPWGDSSAAITG
jgi:hypothetical protein